MLPAYPPAMETEDDIEELMLKNRWCYVIPRDGFVEGHGYRVSIVIENQPGHYPTGSLEVLSKEQGVVHAAYLRGATMPWFWGMTYEEACHVCKEQNLALDISEEDAVKIVSSTMHGYRSEAREHLTVYDGGKK